MTSFVTGRYHRPRLEERVFLFMDLVNSTTIAEHLGPLRFHGLLDRIAFDIADAVATYHGEIHRYVGDEIIVTWPADRGLRDAACVRTAFAMVGGVDRRQAGYVEDFGVKPAFHLAIHVGPVVVGEMGDLHREIVFLGDTVNTTARIEAASADTGRSVLVSQELIDQLGALATRDRDGVDRLDRLARQTSRDPAGVADVADNGTLGGPCAGHLAASSATFRGYGVWRGLDEATSRRRDRRRSTSLPTPCALSRSR